MSRSTTTVVNVETRAPRKGWHIALWVAQVLLAVAFGFAGVTKLATPYGELAQKSAALQHTPQLLVKFIAAAELAGALGLILPATTRVKPSLTPLAATGLGVIMVFATGLHIYLGDSPIVSVIIGSIAAFIAWGAMAHGAGVTARRYDVMIDALIEHSGLVLFV